MKKLILFLSLFAFMLGGCKGKDISRPNYIEFAEQQVENENPLYEYYYTITETNDENIVLITIYRGVYFEDIKFIRYSVYGVYFYNIEEGKEYAIR